MIDESKRVDCRLDSGCSSTRRSRTLPNAGTTRPKPTGKTSYWPRWRTGAGDQAHAGARRGQESGQGGRAPDVRDMIAACSTKVERMAAWQEQTQKSERAFFRRLKEVGCLTD